MKVFMIGAGDIARHHGRAVVRLGGEVIGVMTQKLSTPVSATCVGSGRVEDIAEFCDLNEIDLVIFDRELTPIQIRNLEREVETTVLDRTMLILDIFAQRARSVEGKLQVELAQLKYMMPRLTGRHAELSRLGGGIGTRGPGETKLETSSFTIPFSSNFASIDAAISVKI